MAIRFWKRGSGGEPEAPVPVPFRAGERMQLVIVGGGMAAHHLVESLVSNGGTDHYDITLISKEAQPPYDRVHLGSLVEGRHADLVFRDADWYGAHDVTLRLKEAVTRIDFEAKTLESDLGASQAYDLLVLAMGGTPFMPPIEGSELPGVMTFRTIEDAAGIADAARGAERAVVVGGGLLGLEVARSIQGLGPQVDVIEMAPRLLPRQLDVAGAAVLMRQVEALGLAVRIDTRVEDIERRDGRLRVDLSDATKIDADLVVFASGIRPVDALAREAGLACHPGGGILVGDDLETSVSGVHAIGECARHETGHYGLVAPCYEMAATLADRLLGGTRLFRGAPVSARLKVPEVQVAAVGESLADGTTVRDLTWTRWNEYKRIVLRDGRLVGAISVGDSEGFARIQEAVARRQPVGARHERRFAREGALWPSGSAVPVDEWADEAVVCTCTGVTIGTLRAHRAGGATTSLALGEATGAGSGCGSCQPLLAELCGEAVAARRQPSSIPFRVLAFVGAALVAMGWAIGPIPMSESVLQSPAIDFLWRDGWWKQATGFTLLGLMTLGLLLPVSQNWTRLRFGSLRRARSVHSGIGVATLLAVGIHSGLRMGANLNFVLMAAVLGLLAVGVLVAVVSSLEHRLPPEQSGRLRRVTRAVHVALLWPVPVLIGLHVLSVYVY